jgi:hypothetical protein
MMPCSAAPSGIRSSRRSSFVACLGDGIAEFSDFGGIAFVLAELALDLGHLLAQQMLALAIAELLLDAAADLRGQPEHFEPLCEQRQYAVEPPVEGYRFQYLLLLVGRYIEIGRRHVGKRRRGCDVLDGVAQPLRRLRQKLNGFQRLVAQVDEPRLYLRAFGRGLLDPLDPCDQERPAMQELDDAKARLPLHDEVIGFIGTGDVAQHVRDRPHAVHVERRRVLQLCVSLGEDADRPALAHRRLRAVDRGGTPDRQRHHHIGEHHEVAHRQDDHGVGRQIRHRRADFDSLRARLRAVRSGQGIGHLRAPPFVLCNVTSRQPWRLDRRTAS